MIALLKSLSGPQSPAWTDFLPQIKVFPQAFIDYSCGDEYGYGGDLGDGGHGGSTFDKDGGAFGHEGGIQVYGYQSSPFVAGPRSLHSTPFALTDRVTEIDKRSDGKTGMQQGCRGNKRSCVPPAGSNRKRDQGHAMTMIR